jgi:hypothetical protein
MIWGMLFDHNGKSYKSIKWKQLGYSQTFDNFTMHPLVSNGSKSKAN